MKVLIHVVRYLLTAALAWVLYPLQALVVYALLLLAAIVLGGDLGGPLGLALMLSVAGLAGAIITPAVIMPAVILGELAARRMPWPGWRWVAAPIFAAVVVFVLSIGAVTIWATTGGLSAAAAAEIWIVASTFSLLPFAVAAVTAHGLAAAAQVLRSVRRRLRQLLSRLFGVKRFGRAHLSRAASGQQSPDHRDHHAAQQQSA